MTFRRIKLIIITLVASVSFALASSSVALAASAANCGQTGAFLGFPTWYKYLEPTFVDGECGLNFSFPGDIGLVLAAVIEILLRVAALVAVVFVLVGGVRYIISQGEPDRLSDARGTIINALIGLVIAVAATAVVSFVAGRFIAS
jgi:hypothetical protein